MKYAICCPTFGNSAYRLGKLLESIRRFTGGLDYDLYVSDDATPSSEAVAAQEDVARKFGVAYTHRTEHGHIFGNFHSIGMQAAPNCDVLVFIADDTLVSPGWLHCIGYFYRMNPELNLSMVSGVMIEAWELAINGIIPNEDSFYVGPHCDGLVMREHLTYTWDQYEKAHQEHKVHLDMDYLRGQGNVGVMGCDENGNYVFNRPSSLSGGLGPCFSILADVFLQIGGFKKAQFCTDFESLLGWSAWDLGFSCAVIPSPPIYHGRGYASMERDGLWNAYWDPEFSKYRLPHEDAIERFRKSWPMFTGPADAQDYYHKKHVYPACDRMGRSVFLPYNVVERRFRIEDIGYAGETKTRQ